MWKYTSNQFLVATQINYKKALILSNYHNAALFQSKTDNPTDADIEKIYQRYNPLAQALAQEYSNWKEMGGIKEASTLNVDQIMATISSKLNVWEPHIQTKYIKTSPQYKAILANGRLGLTRGKMEERIANLKAFAQSLTGIADLATIKQQVDEFYDNVENARQTQLGKKSNMGKGTEAVVQAIEAAMIMQYRNLGLLMDKYYNKTNVIESFFDLETLQESTQTSFTGTLDPSENEAILVHTFMADDELRLKITGNGAARFYLSNTANGVNSELVQVAANTTLVVAVDEFLVPDYSTYRYLTALNPSSSETLKYEVEVL